jgi:hypothetical protein
MYLLFSRSSFERITRHAPGFLYYRGNPVQQLSVATQDRLRRAFAHARTRCLRNPDRPSDVVFQALVDATDVWRRLPDPEKWSPRRPTRSPWPGLLRTPKEREDAYWHQMWMVCQGRASPDSLITMAAPTPDDISTMDDIFTVFPTCLRKRRGDKRRRDWNVLRALADRKATGDRGPTAIAKKYGVSRECIDDIRILQLAAIADALGEFIDCAVRPPVTGRILFDVAA